jgi:hypothetical protein
MFKKDNDPNRLGRDLRWFFSVSVIPSFGFVSDFGFRASDFLGTLRDAASQK